MSEKNNSTLSDDALWAKCQQGGAITSQNLGLDTPNSTGGTTFLTEGTNYHQFELSSERKK